MAGWLEWLKAKGATALPFVKQLTILACKRAGIPGGPFIADVLDHADRVEQEFALRGMETLLEAVVGQGQEILRALEARPGLPVAGDSPAWEPALEELLRTQDGMQTCMDRIVGALTRSRTDLTALVEDLRAELGRLEGGQRKIHDGVQALHAQQRLALEQQNDLAEGIDDVADRAAALLAGQAGLQFGQRAIRAELQHAARSMVAQVLAELRAHRQTPPAWWVERWQAGPAGSPGGDRQQAGTGSEVRTPDPTGDSRSAAGTATTATTPTPTTPGVVTAARAAAREPIRRAMLRLESGAIYLLRALPTLVIGRDENTDWQVFIVPRSRENDRRSQCISRRHLKLTYNGEGFTACDLGSTASTFRESRALTPRTPATLHDGDELSLGGALTVKAWLFPDTDPQSAVRHRPSARRLAARAGALAAPLVIGDRAPGLFRSVVLRRLENFPQQRCLWVLKRVLLGADTALCEVVVPGAPGVAATLAFSDDGFALVSRGAGLCLGSRELPPGTRHPLADEDLVTFPGGQKVHFLLPPDNEA